jgi:hypothetical protein
LPPKEVLVSVPQIDKELAETVAVVGAAFEVIVTVFADAAHGLFEIVQVSTYVPAVVGVNVEELEAVLLNCVKLKLGPEVTLHAPVPTLGMFAAKVAAVP